MNFGLMELLVIVVPIIIVALLVWAAMALYRKFKEGAESERT